MRDETRRRFLKGSVAAAGWAALTGAIADATDRPSDTAGERSDQPPTRRFLAAVERGDLVAVRSWLDRDPGLLWARDGAGRTAFALALLERHGEIAALLLERGYRSDLHETALATDWERFERLAAETPAAIDRDHPIGGTAMYAAALGGAGTQIWRVYRYGGHPDADPRGSRGFTALRAALEHPDLGVAELTASSLLANGADPNGRQPGGSSVLHAAAGRGSTVLVETLIRKGATIDARDDDGRTALDAARAAGHQQVAWMLARHTTIPRDCTSSRQAYDVDGRPYRPPELEAFSIVERSRVVGVAHRDLDDLRDVVQRHPRLAHSVATTTEAAVEAGAHMGRQDIVDFLLERGAPYAVPTAVMRGDRTRVLELLEQDPHRIHERGAHDFPLLWYPVIGGNRLEMTELLLDHGAEIERQHVLGTTALHYACLGGQVEMAELLIDRGADVRRVGRKFGGEPRTPLQLAEDLGHLTIVRLLREHGAES